MLKYAGELRIGDVWRERTEGGDTRDYRVIAVRRGLAPAGTRHKSIRRISKGSVRLTVVHANNAS
jgi:hypothetical protein